MVQLQYSLLAFAFSQLVSAFPKPDADSTLQQRQAGPNDQFVFAICPRSPQKCSQCGGDSRKKGFCDNEIATGYRSDYNRCVRWHGEGEECGLICECISEETGKPGTGAPPIIPFPPIPVGFVPPPAAVPNPKTEESCGNDYTKTSCKDCEPLDGWCTKGEKAGCPCREECPADDDDNKPSCSADDCKGEQGSCTIGHHKGCKCKSECPNPDKKILVCSDDICKSEMDNKCTTDEYNGCDCYHIAKDYYTMRSKAQVQSDTAAIEKLVASMKKFYDEQGEEDDEPKDPEVTCASKDYSEAIEVDASFLNKLADKFCSGDADKKRSQDLTAKDISSGAYENYKFHLELDPGDDCKTDCKAAFKSMSSKCQGLDSHSIQKSASAKVADCGASFSYEITVPEAEEAPDTFTQEGEQERVCHTIEEIGTHGDVRGGEMSRAALMCLGVEDDKAQFTSGSEPVTRTMESGGTQYAITMSWVDNCEGDSQDVRYPHGKENNTLGDTCWMLMLHNWEDCTGNKGAGGYIDYGCVRYDFRPTFD